MSRTTNQGRVVSRETMKQSKHLGGAFARTMRQVLDDYGVNLVAGAALATTKADL